MKEKEYHIYCNYYNMSDIEETLNFIARRNDYRSSGDVAFGWKEKSAGKKVQDAQGKLFWLKVLVKPENISDKLWNGEIDANKIKNVKKPNILKFTDILINKQIYRIVLMTYIPFPVCSDSSELKNSITLESTWFAQLKNSLKSLKRITTDRQAVRQDLINRRIKELFGDNIDTKVTSWVTCHGDLHWGNLTQEQCWILDWEAWGLAPEGFDAAFLYCFSLLQPNIANMVYRYFADELNSKDGQLCLMFACAELLRMIDLYSDHPRLKMPLKRLIHDLAVKNRIKLP